MCEASAACFPGLALPWSIARRRARSACWRRIYDRPKVEDLSNDRCPYEVGRVRVRNLVKDTASDNDIYDASFRESDEAID